MKTLPGHLWSIIQLFRSSAFRNSPNVSALRIPTPCERQETLHYVHESRRDAMRAKSFASSKGFNVGSNSEAIRLLRSGTSI
mmetsp:Transcript_82348/g.163388  ORF Transcript_82348/g.163388 Transcript_82348/m.163388 type:complete len:82 (+) Transcript_82348:73-318(+)